VAGVTGRPDGHGLDRAAVADVGAFLARVTRLDPATLVRLRPDGRGGTALWARLPWEVLATRTVPGGPGRDVTVAATALLAELAAAGPALPATRDEQWRWPLPPARVEVVEEIPEAVVRRVGAAAGRALREASAEGVGGRPVGARVARDTLLDHVSLVVSAGHRRFEVSQRLVQGILRMGFLGSGAETERAHDAVSVLAAGTWVGLAGRYGSVWRQQRVSLGIRPAGSAREG
jgi:hypothetical protein